MLKNFNGSGVWQGRLEIKGGGAQHGLYPSLGAQRDETGEGETMGGFKASLKASHEFIHIAHKQRFDFVRVVYLITPSLCTLCICV